MSQVQYHRTADGLLAAQVGSMAYGLLAMGDGSLRYLPYYGRGRVEDAKRGDFTMVGRAIADEAAFRAEMEDIALHQRQLATLARRQLSTAEIRAIASPWEMDGGQMYAEGVVSVSGPSHGGFVLDAERNALVHPAWRVGGEDAGCYEEDLCWAIVAQTFPSLFTERERRQAARTLIASMPDEWEAATGIAILPGQSPERERALFMAANKGRLMARAAVASKIHPGKVVVTATVDMDGSLRHAKTFLMDEQRYLSACRSNPAGTMLIDEATEARVDANEEPFARAA